MNVATFEKMIIKAIIQVVSIKGYSLYSRLVSSMLVWTPFPRGTSTPSNVTAAPGSGAVLPKPVSGGKNKAYYKMTTYHYTIALQILLPPFQFSEFLTFDTVLALG